MTEVQPAEGVGVGHASGDAIAWASHYWREQGLGHAEDLFLALTSSLRFHRLLTEAVDAKLKESSLNLTDYLLIMTLQLSERGSRLISGLARSVLIHPTTATLATDRLEERGLLQRTPHPTDRRATVVTLTDAGHELALTATKSLESIDFGFAGATHEDGRELVELTSRLRQLMGDVH